MKTVSIKLPVPLADWLARQARESGRSKSALIRQALEEHRSRPGKDSCLDLMADLCGSVCGPRALSTHPKHLEGFGQ